MRFYSFSQRKKTQIRSLSGALPLHLIIFKIQQTERNFFVINIVKKFNAFFLHTVNIVVVVISLTKDKMVLVLTTATERTNNFIILFRISLR
jgi:hypothetical protein